MANERKSPTLRCPGCGGEVALPAQSCPACGYNFREGRRPGAAPPASQAGPKGRPAPAGPSGDDAPQGRNWTRYVAGALAAVALIIIISLLAGRGEEEKAAAPAAPPAAQPSVLEGTPRVMGPAMLNPRVPIGLAKDAASAAEEGHAETEGTYEEIQR